MEPCAAAPFAYGVFLSQLLARPLSQSLSALPTSPKGTANPLSPFPRLRGFSLLKAGRSFLRSAALSQKAALQMSSPSTTPPMKMGYRNARRRSDIPKFKIIFPLTMPKAQRRAF